MCRPLQAVPCVDALVEQVPPLRCVVSLPLPRVPRWALWLAGVVPLVWGSRLVKISGMPFIVGGPLGRAFGGRLAGTVDAVVVDASLWT